MEMENRFLKPGLSILFCIFLLNYSYGRTWNVASVNDINKALLNVAPGDVLLMKNGLWTDAKIVFGANGTKNQPITLISETPGQVVLTGKSSIEIKGKNLVVSGVVFRDEALTEGAIVHFLKNTANCRLTNSAIITDKFLDKKANIKWIVIEGRENRLDHSYFKNKTSKGPLVSVVATNKPSYHLIDSNYFGYRAPLGYNGAEIIRIGLGQTQEFNSVTTVAYNYFEECNGEHEVISSKTGGNIFKYNTFKRSQGTLSLRHGNGSFVYNNFFLGEGKEKTGGVKIFGEGHEIVNNYFSGLRGTGLYAALVIMNGSDDPSKNEKFVLFGQVKNVSVENNIFVDNSENIIVGFNYDNATVRNLVPENVTFSNNTFYKSRSAIVQLKSNPVGFKWSQNIVYDAEPGINVSGGFIDEDPKLKQSSDGVWRTTAASPSIAKAKGILKSGSNSAGDSITNTEASPLTGKEVGPSFLNILQ